MQRYKSVTTLFLLIIMLSVFTVPVFATHPWVEKPGKGKAEDVLDEHPWIGGRGNGKNAEGLLDDNPWTEDPGKRKGNNLLNEHPWIGGPGKGKGGAGAGIDWMDYIRGYLRIFY